MTGIRSCTYLIYHRSSLQDDVALHLPANPAHFWRSLLCWHLWCVNGVVPVRYIRGLRFFSLSEYGLREEVRVFFVLLHLLASVIQDVELLFNPVKQNLWIPYGLRRHPGTFVGSLAQCDDLAKCSSVFIMSKKRIDEKVALIYSSSSLFPLNCILTSNMTLFVVGCQFKFGESSFLSPSLVSIKNELYANKWT